MKELLNYLFLNNTIKTIIRLLIFLFCMDIKIIFILIFILFIQNTVTKNNLLNVYSLGLFSTYNEVSLVIGNLTKLLIISFLLTKIEILFS